MKRVLFATGNAAKVNRFKSDLLKNGIELLSIKDLEIDIDEPIENGNNAIENALIKARHYYNHLKVVTMAMDDTLFIDGIPDNLQPGMYVRRVNGKKLNDEEMIEYYSSLAKEYGNEDGLLTARWIYGLAVIVNGKEKTFTWSKDDFYITSKPSKIITSGYPLNSISINKKLNKYFTDITEEDKLLIKEDEHEVIEFISSCVNEKENKRSK